MIWMSEHTDIWVQSLQGMFSVLIGEISQTHSMYVMITYCRVNYRQRGLAKFVRVYVEGCLTGQSLCDLLVHNHSNFDAPLSGCPQHVIEAVLLIARRRPTKVELRAQPPVLSKL